MNVKEFIVINIFRLSLVAVILVVFLILFDIISKGIGIMSWTFIFDVPRNSMREGGIFPAIVGTIYVVILMNLSLGEVGILGM